jgi:hypothetical protein
VSCIDAIPCAAWNLQPVELFLVMTIVLLELWFKSRRSLCFLLVRIRFTKVLRLARLKALSAL